MVFTSNALFCGPVGALVVVLGVSMGLISRGGGERGDGGERGNGGERGDGGWRGGRQYNLKYEDCNLQSVRLSYLSLVVSPRLHPH